MLIPQKHSFLEMLLNKSLTQRLMVRSFVPLLALPSYVTEGVQLAGENKAEETR